MPGRRGGMVYHWKHGWIPLDHAAALSKAHHSKSGAVKVMQKHGIDVPKGYSSDHKSTAKPSAPKLVSKDHNLDHAKTASIMADQLDANHGKFRSPESRLNLPLLSRALREGRYDHAVSLAARIDSLEAREFAGMDAPGRSAMQKVISAAGAAKRAAK